MIKVNSFFWTLIVEDKIDRASLIKNWLSVGIYNLQDDFHTFLHSNLSLWTSLDNFLNEMIAWLDNYKFNDLLKTDYGECSVETLINLKKRLIAAIEKKSAKWLE